MKSLALSSIKHEQGLIIGHFVFFLFCFFRIYKKIIVKLNFGKKTNGRFSYKIVLCQFYKACLLPWKSALEIPALTWIQTPTTRKCSVFSPTTVGPTNLHTEFIYFSYHCAMHNEIVQWYLDTTQMKQTHIQHWVKQNNINLKLSVGGNIHFYPGPKWGCLDMV